MSKVKLSSSNNNNKVPAHDELMDRIRKTLYYGSSLKCHRISRPVADYAAEIFSETHRGHSLHRLNFATVGKFNNVTPCPLLIAMIYLDRLNKTDPNFTRKITPSELFLVSLMVSTKFYSGHDEEIYISDWAKYGNISAERMMEIELEFLSAMDWNLYVSNADFFTKLSEVEKVLAKRQGFARGWLTYTELVQLLPSVSLAREIFNYTSLMCISYTASVFAIVGAFFIASYVPGTALFTKSTSIDRSVSNETSTNCTLNHINPSVANPSISDDQIDELEADLIGDDDDDVNSTDIKIHSWSFFRPQSRNDNEIAHLDTNCWFGDRLNFATNINLFDNKVDNDGPHMIYESKVNRQNYSSLLLKLFHTSKLKVRSRFHDLELIDQKELMPFVWSTFL